MRALLLIASVLVACGGAHPKAAATGEPGFLVWSAQPARTIWFGPDGAQRGAADGIWMATTDGLWRLEERTEERTTTGCEPLGEDKVSPGTAKATYPTLLSGDGKTRVVPWPTDLAGVDEYGSWDEHTAVIASLGDRLFLVSYADGYSCGAHGNVGAMGATFDLSARSLRKHDDRPADPRIAATAEAALTEPVDRLDEDGWQIGMTAPGWRGDELIARHLVYVGACYACGNGEWSSYTWGQWVDDVRVPDDWSRPVLPPPARAALVGDGPRGVSWGTADATWAATFAAR